MVSRREKLKLSQSKAQEQIFNLHVKLINQELCAGNTHLSAAVLKSYVDAGLVIVCKEGHTGTKSS